MKIGLYAAMDNGPVKDQRIAYIAVDQGLTHLYKQGIQCLLVQYPDTKITLYDRQNKITYLPKGHHHIPVTDDYFSLFALKDTVLSLNHCQYPLDHYLLNRLIRFAYPIPVKIMSSLIIVKRSFSYKQIMKESSMNPSFMNVLQLSSNT